MKKSLKLSFVCVLSLVLCLSMLLSACGGQAQKSNAASTNSALTNDSTTIDNSTADKTGKTAPAEKVTLKLVSSANNEQNLNFEKSVREEYMKENPNVTLTVEQVDSSQYATWIQAQLMGGTAPDVFGTDYMTAQEFLRSGLIVDLTSYFDKENKYNAGKKWLDTFSDGVKVQMIDPTNEKISLVPTAVGVNKFVYNKSLFKKAGIDKIPETYAEFLQVCDKLKAAGITPAAQSMKYSGGNANMTFQWVLRAFTDGLTYDLMDQLDLNKSYFIDTNEIVAGVDKGIIDITKSPWKDAIKLGKDYSKYWLPGYTAMDTNTTIDKFAKGEVAMLQCGIWMLKPLYDNQSRNFDIGVFKFPMITKETSPYASGKYVQVGGEALGCLTLNSSLKGANLDTAIDYLQFVTSPKYGDMLAQSLWQMSPITNVEVKGAISDYVLDYTPARLRSLYESYFSQKFFEDAVLMAQLYYEDKISLDDYTTKLNESLKQVCREFMEKNNWNASNNYGLKK